MTPGPWAGLINYQDQKPTEILDLPWLNMAGDVNPYQWPTPGNPDTSLPGKENPYAMLGLLAGFQNPNADGPKAEGPVMTAPNQGGSRRMDYGAEIARLVNETTGGNGKSPLGGLKPVQIDTSEIQKYLTQLQAQSDANKADRMPGIKRLEAKADEIAGREPGFNLAPLMALSDAWFGGNMAKNYTPPASREQLDQQEMAVREAADRLRMGLSDDQMKVLQSQLGVSQHVAGMKQQAEQSNLDNQLKLITTQAQINNQMKIATLEALQRSEDNQKKMELQRYLAQLDAMGKDADRALKYQLAQARTVEEREKIIKAADDQDKRTYLSAVGMLNQDAGIKAVGGIVATVRALNEYEKLLRNFNGRPGDPDAAQLATAYQNVLVNFKNAAGLGALSGPDMGILTSAVKDMSQLGPWLSSFIGGVDKEGNLRQVEQMRKAFKADVPAHLSTARNIADRLGSPRLSAHVDNLKKDVETYTTKTETTPGVGVLAPINDAKPTATGPAQAAPSGPWNQGFTYGGH